MQKAGHTLQIKLITYTSSFGVVLLFAHKDECERRGTESEKMCMCKAAKLNREKKKEKHTKFDLDIFIL